MTQLKTCIYCGIKTTGSIGGDCICPSCDIGIKWDPEIRKFRNWQPHDNEYHRLMGFKPLITQKDTNKDDHM